MRLLVTGASGDIGSRLIRRLIKTGSEQSTLELYTTDIKPLPIDQQDADEGNIDVLQHKQCDIRSDELVEWIKSIKPNVIVHLASIVQLPETMSTEEAFDIDVNATERLLSLASEIGVKKFVVTSSGAAYGYWPDNPEWIDENLPVRGNDDYFYSKHKKHIENLLLAYRENHPHLKQVILRPGTVLGPNFKNPITNLFEKKNITGIAGSDSPFVIIWVDDLVEYLVESIISDIEGVFNVAGDGALTLPQIAKILNKPFIALPALLVKSFLAIGKLLKVTQYGPEQVKFIQYRPVLSNKKIKRTFKHQPSKTTHEAFSAFLAESDEEYVKQ